MCGSLLVSTGVINWWIDPSLFLSNQLSLPARQIPWSVAKSFKELTLLASVLIEQVSMVNLAIIKMQGLGTKVKEKRGYLSNVMGKNTIIGLLSHFFPHIDSPTSCGNFMCLTHPSHLRTWIFLTHYIIWKAEALTEPKYHHETLGHRPVCRIWCWGRDLVFLSKRFTQRVETPVEAACSFLSAPALMNSLTDISPHGLCLCLSGVLVTRLNTGVAPTTETPVTAIFLL